MSACSRQVPAREILPYGGMRVLLVRRSYNATGGRVALEAGPRAARDRVGVLSTRRVPAMVSRVPVASVRLSKFRELVEVLAAREISPHPALPHEVLARSFVYGGFVVGRGLRPL